jgi:hypothetical protein
MPLSVSFQFFLRGGEFFAEPLFFLLAGFQFGFEASDSRGLLVVISALTDRDIPSPSLSELVRVDTRGEVTDIRDPETLALGDSEEPSDWLMP